MRANPASHALVDKLGIAVTTVEELAVVRGNLDRVFSSSDVAVVRPDRYLFGHTTENLSLDALLSVLEDRLYLSEI